ncbi:MAG: trypsin-like peptidase domain-containing protein [Candidatus Brocadiae bacterium]|nr:trypsin-like peptidase domain-containing protein [Candidatus Brocadiia bacterium]
MFRPLRLALSAFLGLVACAGTCVAERVAVAADSEEVLAAVAEGLKQAGHSVVTSGTSIRELGGRPVRELLGDEGLFRDAARRVWEGPGAKVLILASLDGERTGRNEDLGTVQWTAGVTIAGIYGQTGASVGRSSNKEKGSASGDEKAAAKARTAALEKALPAFLEQMKAGLGSGETKARKMTVTVTDLPETLYTGAGLKMRRFLEKLAGAGEVTPAYSAAEKRMTLEFLFEGDVARLEDLLRADRKFLGDFLLVESGERGLVFRINASRMTLLIVGHDPAKLQEAGKKVLEALKANPDTVDEAASFANGAWTATFLSSSRAADLHEALIPALGDIGGRMHLSVMGVDGLAYRFGGSLVRVRVEDLGPDSYEETGLALSGAVERIAGVDGVVREYSAADRAMTLNVFTSGSRTALEGALRAEHAGVGELSLVKSEGDLLTFALALRALTFRIRGVQPDIVSREGRSFAEAARRVAGVRSMEWSQESGGDFTVSLLWKGTAAAFHAGIEKELKGFRLVRAREAEAEYSVGGRAVTVVVEGLVDGFYEDTQRVLTEKLTGLKGVTGIRRFYDASKQSLGFIVYCEGDARGLEDALKGRQGKSLKELTVVSSGDDVLVLRLGIRETRLVLQGADAAVVREAGEALGSGLKGQEGIAAATWQWDENPPTFEIVIHSAFGPMEAHAAAMRCLATHRLAPQVHLQVARESRLAYRVGEVTVSGTVEVRNLPPEGLGRVGDALAASLKEIPGVRQAGRSYDEGSRTLSFAVSFAGTMAELDEALWGAVTKRAELAELQPAGVGGGAVAFTWKSGEFAITITVAGVVASAVDGHTRTISDAVATLGGVKVDRQGYDEKSGALTVALTSRRRAHEIDEAVRATPGGLTLVKSTAETLVYEAPPAAEQLVMLEVRNVDARTMKGAGTEFLKLLRAIPGVAKVENDYLSAREAMLISVIFAGRGVDLDSEVWGAMKGRSEFDGLFPGDLALGLLVYEFRAEGSTTGVAISVQGVRPTALAEVKAAVAPALAAMEGLSAVSETYDDTTEVLSLSGQLTGRPADAFAAFQGSMEGSPAAPRFTLRRAAGTELIYAYGAPASAAGAGEFSVQVSGWREKDDAALGTGLVAALAGVGGLEGVKGAWRPDLFSFVISFTTALDPAAVDDGVRKALAGDPGLARVRVGALRNGLLICGLEPAGGGEAAPAVRRSSLEDLVRRVDPGVVFIRTTLKANPNKGWIGSGFLVSASGLVVTNNHVISAVGADGKPVPAAELETRVKLSDGRWFEASVVVTDPEIDAAVLEIQATGLPALELGNSEGLRIGQDLFVIGNPLGLEHSVTTGIVSAFGRMGGRIQTNALINHGNSGGPAFDMEGRVIGVSVSGAVANYAFDGQKVEVPQPGINFLIPINHIRPLLEQAGR